MHMSKLACTYDAMRWHVTTYIVLRVCGTTAAHYPIVTFIESSTLLGLSGTDFEFPLDVRL